tara:strand:+ start:9362 stop:10051 length:690 start_codon:yes stop_codon:yes gene_type:complete
LRKAEKYKMIRQGSDNNWEKLDSFGLTTAEQLKQADVVLFKSINPIKEYSTEYNIIYVMPTKGYKPLKEIFRRANQVHAVDLKDAVQEFVLGRIDEKNSVKERVEKRKEYLKNLKVKYENINLKEMHDWAMKVANQSVDKELLKYPNGEPELACGFAWVNVRGVRQNSKLGKQFEELGYSWDFYFKSYSLWNTSNYNGQCIMIKEASANAYATVMSKAGYKASSGSRLD